MKLVGIAFLSALALCACRSHEAAAPTALTQASPVVMEARFPARPAVPAPADLQAELTTLTQNFPGIAGVAVMDLEQGWTAGYRQDQVFPQQSVSKLWVAISVLDAIDQGRLTHTTLVPFGPQDLSVFSQPIAQVVKPFGTIVTVDDLLRRAIIQSDNAADDMLIRLAGGVPAVEATLAGKQIRGLAVGADQRVLQSRIAGLTWDPRFAGEAPEFSAARARVAPEIRAQRIEEYLAAPPDGATPAATVAALAQLQRGQLLSEGSTVYLLDTLSRVRTGPRRLRGGLGEGWRLGHKTGTGPDFRGESLGINDVGLITAPDGHVYAVAVFIARTRAPNPVRLEYMQAVSRAVQAHWQAAHGSAEISGGSAASTAERG
jgi:beta-lactamase class A